MKQIVKEKSTKKSLKNSYKLDTNKRVSGFSWLVSFLLSV